MKKIVKSVLTFMACAMLTGCGAAGFPTMGDSTTTNTPSTSQNAGANLGGLLGNLISSVTGGIGTNQQALQGTWVYAKPCVQFESDNLLSQAGGTVMAEKAEKTLDTYYKKLGIKPGTSKFIFNKDNTLQYTIGTKTYNGTYKFDAQKKTVALTTAMGTTLNAYVSIVDKHMGLTFDVSNLLTLIKNHSSASAQMTAISALAKNYKGMKLGFEFNK